MMDSTFKLLTIALLLCFSAFKIATARMLDSRSALGARLKLEEAIGSIEKDCWPGMLGSLGYTSEEGDILHGYCDASDDSSAVPLLPPPSTPLFKAPQLMNKIRVPLLLIFVLCLSTVVPEPLQTHCSRFPRSSMASDNFVQPAIPRFDGHYDHWSMLMENFLRSKDYWQVVSGGIQELAPGTAVTDAQRAEIEGMKLKDLKAKNYLFQAIDRSILETILCKDSSKQIWDSMRKKYQGTAKAKRQQLQALRADFETLRMKSGESVSDYFSRVMTIVNKMRIHGDKSDDVIVVEKILRSMTPKFNYVVCSIEESKDIDELSLDELQSSLLVHEHKLNQQDKDEHALKVSTRTYGGRGRGKGSKNQKYQQQQPSNQPRDSLGRGRGRGGSHFDARRQKPKDKSEIQCYRCKRQYIPADFDEENVDEHQQPATIIQNEPIAQNSHTDATEQRPQRLRRRPAWMSDYEVYGISKGDASLGCEAYFQIPTRYA
ncbi:hypothetical protein BUALT_Bualt11G0005400 [Buddleja alternifolia]|uniref:Retrovirus-related Pol polyprotein from transposon TNT 1-94 n=1 Tax=Buddleja alternifolia TaxID=168488 RepID=A0AAV6X2A3_9LAMI|nr:hypothetical protein BUALT_Bualt11G0005400 [Buddleja alternifolia]